MKDAAKDFKAFILRGNVVDLAVGVAIGAAFTAVVTSFTKNLLTPILAIPGDKASFAEPSILHPQRHLQVRRLHRRRDRVRADRRGTVLPGGPAHHRHDGPAQDRARSALDHPGLPLLPLVDSDRRQPLRLLHR